MANFFKKFLVFLGLFFVFLLGLSCGFLIKKNYFSDLKESNGRINFLILGLRDFQTKDGDLTDTIIFLSLSSQRSSPVIISLPRDLWVESLKAKINTAYHYGGTELMKKTVEEIIGQKIHYTVVVNFESFRQIVDALGGVTINVQRPFDDYRYPIAGKENDLCGGDKEFKCRYEHLHFDAGPQSMDGERALKFVRSRNAEGEEGTDFARSQRQQQLIFAIKQKVLSPKFYLNPGKVKTLVKIVQNNIITDIKPENYGSFFFLFTQTPWSRTKTIVLNENLLTHPKNHYSKQWVLLPKNGNWQEIQKFVQELLSE